MGTLHKCNHVGVEEGEAYIQNLRISEVGREGERGDVRTYCIVVLHHEPLE